MKVKVANQVRSYDIEDTRDMVEKILFSLSLLLTKEVVIEIEEEVIVDSYDSCTHYNIYLKMKD